MSPNHRIALSQADACRSESEFQRTAHSRILTRSFLSEYSKLPECKKIPPSSRRHHLCQSDCDAKKRYVRCKTCAISQSGEATSHLEDPFHESASIINLYNL